MVMIGAEEYLYRTGDHDVAVHVHNAPQGPQCHS